MKKINLKIAGLMFVLVVLLGGAVLGVWLLSNAFSTQSARIEQLRSQVTNFSTTIALKQKIADACSTDPKINPDAVFYSRISGGQYYALVGNGGKVSLVSCWKSDNPIIVQDTISAGSEGGTDYIIIGGSRKLALFPSRDDIPKDKYSFSFDLETKKFTRLINVPAALNVENTKLYSPSTGYIILDFTYNECEKYVCPKEVTSFNIYAIFSDKLITIGKLPSGYSYSEGYVKTGYLNDQFIPRTYIAWSGFWGEIPGGETINAKVFSLKDPLNFMCEGGKHINLQPGSEGPCRKAVAEITLGRNDLNVDISKLK